jgi:hypothetical protein
VSQKELRAVKNIKKNRSAGAFVTLLKVSALGAIGLVVMFLCAFFCRSACSCIREEDQARREALKGDRLIRITAIEVVRPVDQASLKVLDQASLKASSLYYWSVIEQQAWLALDTVTRGLRSLEEENARISALRMCKEKPYVCLTKDMIRRLRETNGDKNLIEKLSRQLREATGEN